ncbi:MAG TPA: fluoride efflux transporter CrcB [Angustibacter sp.]|nr:fluoride efflux transporter CrcB [Angustibacter sp.]
MSDARRLDWPVLLSIGAGGAVGAAARWGVSQAVPTSPGQFPWATLGVNVSGCLALGVLMVFVVDVWPPRRYVRPFLGVGVLGGYTTFSTYVLEARSLVVDGAPGLAALYLLGSLLAGLLAVWVAVVATRAVVRLTRHRRAGRRSPQPVVEEA